MLDVLAESVFYNLGRLLVPTILGALAYWAISAGNRRSGAGEAALVIVGILLAIIALIDLISILATL